MRGRRHVPSHRRVRGSVRVTLSLAVGLVVLAGGGAFGAYRYDQAMAGRAMPGVTVAGVDISGMTRPQAVDAVRKSIDAALEREVTVRVGGRAWHVSPAELGTRARVIPMVDRALAVGRDFEWPDRVYRRLLDRPVGESFRVRFRYNRDRVERFVSGVARQVYVSPSNAWVDFVDGDLVLQKPRSGRELLERQAQRSLMRALRGDGKAARFALRTLEPEVSTSDIGHTIVVRLSQLKLYLYEGLDLVKTYPVAAGQPAYPTPPGRWEVINKIQNPTWINPAPDGWGAGMPKTIGPGPGNPLGTHAIYLDAPGIRIHGTYDPGSIGSYASHGCVRMYIEDVKELFSIVPMGTPVIITQ